MVLEKVLLGMPIRSLTSKEATGRLTAEYVNKTLGPVGPIIPVNPAEPVGPVCPVKPVGPVVPVFPA
jgi:hypothetical protein